MSSVYPHFETSGVWPGFAQVVPELVQPSGQLFKQAASKFAAGVAVTVILEQSCLTKHFEPAAAMAIEVSVLEAA